MTDKDYREFLARDADVDLRSAIAGILKVAKPEAPIIPIRSPT